MAGIKDLLDNILGTNKPKASASAGVGKPTATSGTGTKATATAGAGTIWGAQALAQQKAILGKKTHQAFINAAYKVAEELKQPSPWPLLKRAGWNNFTNSRDALYTGPIIDDLEKLSAEEKAALKKQMGV